MEEIFRAVPPKRRPTAALLAVLACAALATVVVLAVRAGSRRAPAAAVGTASPSASPPVTEAPVGSIEGTWNGASGSMFLMEVDGVLRGLFGTQEGRLVGTLSGNRLEAWWSQLPSRVPPDDAGEMQFDVARTLGQPQFMHGRWRRGRDGPWQEDFDFTYAGPDIPDGTQEALINDVFPAGEAPDDGSTIRDRVRDEIDRRITP